MGGHHTATRNEFPCFAAECGQKEGTSAWGSVRTKAGNNSLSTELHGKEHRTPNVALCCAVTTASYNSKLIWGTLELQENNTQTTVSTTGPLGNVADNWDDPQSETQGSGDLSCKTKKERSIHTKHRGPGRGRKKRITQNA